MYANKSSLDFIVGDYIKSTNTAHPEVIWLIADIDNYLHTGYPELTKHHVTIIPAKPLDYKPMNAKENHDSQNTTQGGYANSDMVKAIETDPLGGADSTLRTIYEKYIKPDFDTNGTHVLEYRTLLTTEIDATATNRMGGKQSGASSWYGWYPRKLDLMSEMNVYGGIIASSSVWDTGIDNRQYALFRLKPELINSYDGKQFSDSDGYWLKDVATSDTFVGVTRVGNSRTYDASTSNGVRPRFLIGTIG